MNIDTQKNIKDFFTIDSETLRDAISPIYDYSHCGAISLQNILQEDFMKKLDNDILNHENFLNYINKKHSNSEYIIEEEYEFVKLGKDQSTVHEEIFPVAKQLMNAYSKLHKEAGIINPQFNSLSVQRYIPQYKGITPHRDFNSDIGLVSIFCISGCADVGVCDNYNKSNPKILDSTRGSLILFRAPRNLQDQEKKNWRPYHFVENIKSERYSMIIRNVG